jgi:hypothetical protein
VVKPRDKGTGLTFSVNVRKREPRASFQNEEIEQLPALLLQKDKGVPLL